MKFLITLLFYCLIIGEEIYIDLITTNDMHGFIKEQKAYFMNPQYPPTIIGGSGYYKYISDVKQNQSKEDMLILDAGNFFQGSNFGMHDGGKSVIEWMNKLEYDAMVLGQYDFILGASNLNEAIENSTFDILGANLDCNDCLSKVKPYTIKTVKGVNVGILGIVNSNIEELVPLSKLDGATFEYEYNTIKKWVPIMKEMGADIIIVLTSSGVPWDREEIYSTFVQSNSKDTNKHLNAIEMGYFAENVDLIVSGGISKGYRTAWYDPKSHVYTIQNYGNGTSYGHIKLRIDPIYKKFLGIDYVNNNEASHTLFFDDYNPDSEVRKEINEKHKNIDLVNFNLKNEIDYIYENLDNWNVPTLNSKDIDIVTWNCEFFPTANDSTISALSEIVKDIDVDIIAFQEIRKAGWFEKLMQRLPNYDYIVSLQASFMDLAIIYKKDLFEFVNHTELFSDNDYNFAGRPPLKLDLIYKPDNQKLSIINLHMKCCDSGLKRRQNASLMLYNYLIEKELEINDNVVVLGDWNDDLKDKPKEHCFDSFFNDDRFYFANYDIVFDIKQASYPKEPYVSFLDHILLTSNLLTHKVYTLPIDNWMNGFDVYEKYISDHKPVFLTFSIK